MSVPTPTEHRGPPECPIRLTPRLRPSLPPRQEGVFRSGSPLLLRRSTPPAARRSLAPRHPGGPSARRNRGLEPERQPVRSDHAGSHRWNLRGGVSCAVQTALDISCRRLRKMTMPIHGPSVAPGSLNPKQFAFVRLPVVGRHFETAAVLVAQGTPEAQASWPAASRIDRIWMPRRRSPSTADCAGFLATRAVQHSFQSVACGFLPDTKSFVKFKARSNCVLEISVIII